MNHSKHFGFTMIELLFVIVIMGIVGGIALEAVRQYYDGIYKAKIYTQRVVEADFILSKLAKYFENAIDFSIVNLDQDAADGALVGTCVGDAFVDVNTSHDYTVGFVAVDVDSLHGNGGMPGWSENVPSGFTGTSLSPRDADLSVADTIITALYPASNLAGSAVYNHEGTDSSCSDFNWDNSGGSSAYYTGNVFTPGTNTLTLIDEFVANGESYSSGSPSLDKKYLLRTGYAFRALDTGEFVMFTNFRPWRGERYSNNNALRTTLGQEVASFYAEFDNTNAHNTRGSMWRLKVCMRGLDSNLSSSDAAQNAICRERMVHVRY